MQRILIDVDTQFDFMDPQGSLYVPADPSVPEAIRRALNQNYDAIIGSVDSHAYDAWEFKENGGPFPAHCVKGQRGWLRVNPDCPRKQRFIPMVPDARDIFNHRIMLIGGPPDCLPQPRTADQLALEAIQMRVGLYFEKEVYSVFDNPLAMPTVHAILQRLYDKDRFRIQIDVIGYCTGGYCVDMAVKKLCEDDVTRRMAKIRVLSYATAAIGGLEGMEKSRESLTALGAEWIS